MSYLFSRALVEAYLAQSSLDGEPSAPSKSSLTVVSALHSDKTKAFYRPFPSGAETLKLSTANPGAELLTWFQEVSRVRTYRAPILPLSELKVHVRACGKKCSASLAKFDPLTASWKTAQLSLVGASEPFSETWPRWGLMQDGECWERTISVASTAEIVSSLWATPIKRDWKDTPGMATETEDRTRLDTLPRQIFQFWPTVVSSGGGPNTNSKSVKEEGHGNNLTGVVKLWPTPLASDIRPRGTQNSTARRIEMGKQLGLDATMRFVMPCGGGQDSSDVRTESYGPLNPDFAE